MVSWWQTINRKKHRNKTRRVSLCSAYSHEWWSVWLWWSAPRGWGNLQTTYIAPRWRFSAENEWKENTAAGCFSSECCKFNLHLRSNIKSCLKSLIGQGFWGEGAAFLWILNRPFHQETSLCLDSSCQSMDLAWKEQLWSAKCDKKGGRRSCYSNCGKCDGCLLSVSHLHHHLL